MTTLTTMASPARLPFSSLGGARLKNMTNIKNKQNALTSTAPSVLKRHAPADFNDDDSENIDPLIFSTSSKKGRTFDFDTMKSNETPLFAPVPAAPAQYVERAQAAGQKRKAEDSEDAATRTANMKRRAEPYSAPAPAGRSPKHKRIGILSRRRMTTRVNPPSSSAVEPTNALPFSIDAALSGTVPKSTLSSKAPHGKGWQFDIHEDSKDDEMANLMQHSTCTLDISDDEGNSLKGDKDNKENIPPMDGPAAMILHTQVTTTRRDVMTDEVREPLGNLKAEEFYADGCDASSFAAEDSPEQIVDKVSSTIDTHESSLLPLPRANVATGVQNGWEDVIARFAAKNTTAGAGAEVGTENENSKEAAEIQIWESESAKGDDDADAQGLQTDGGSPQSLLA